MGFIKKVLSFIVSPTHTRTIGVLIVFILLTTVFMTVYVAQQQQQIRQRAAEAESQAIPASECIPPYDGYLGCLTESGCANVGISSHASCSDENVQQGVYCYESTKQGQICSINEGSGICDDQGNCVINLSTPTETTVPSQTDQSVPTADPTLTLTPTEEIILPTATDTPVPTEIQLTNIPSIIQSSPIPSSVVSCYLKDKGDANCDNIINLLDFELWRVEFVGMLKGIPTINKPSDFNIDGIIDIVDFNIWKTNFQDSSLPH